MSIERGVARISATIGLSLVSYLVYRKMKNLRGKSQKALIKEVLFFPDSEFPCESITRTDLTHHSCYNPSCRRLHGREGEPSSSMIKFINYLRETTWKLDICIYMLTQPMIVDILLELKSSKKIQIRVITDCSEYQAFGTQIERLRQSGIDTKANRTGTGALMHHKFVIIDDSTLMTGSFNWTNNAVIRNYEAIVVTTDESFVRPFREKFSEMWREFHYYC